MVQLCKEVVVLCHFHQLLDYKNRRFLSSIYTLLDYNFADAIFTIYQQAPVDSQSRLRITIKTVYILLFVFLKKCLLDEWI
jgi:hypothetical protein